MGVDLIHAKEGQRERERNDKANNSIWEFYERAYNRQKFRKFLEIQSRSIIYNKPTRCNSGSIVFINNYKYALHVSDAICVLHQEHYKL